MLISLSIPIIVSIVVIAVLVIAIVIAVVVTSRRNKKPKNTGAVADQVKVVDGVRYSTSENISTASGDVKASHLEGDFVLERGKTFTAQKNGALMPGKYTVLSSIDGLENFNIRHNGFVREFSHGQSIILAEGEQITAVSHTVILR